MGISIGTGWWLATGIVVAIEVATGTFYLLMIALGMAAGGVAFHLGVAATGQLVAAALVGGCATALLRWRRARHPPSAPARENRDVNLDVGERVLVPGWGADRTARVAYRGSAWTAKLAPGAVAAPGTFRVSAVEGNWLVLAPLE